MEFELDPEGQLGFEKKEGFSSEGEGKEKCKSVGSVLSETCKGGDTTMTNMQHSSNSLCFFSVFTPKVFTACVTLKLLEAGMMCPALEVRTM